jgi:protease-4
VATAADRIYANPGTLTGSIGVVMQMANIEGLLKKVGVDYVVVKAGSYKDIGNFARTMTPEERKILQALLDDVYSQFVDAVAEAVVSIESRCSPSPTAGSTRTAGAGPQDGGRPRGLRDAVEAAGKLANISGRPKLLYPRKRFSVRDLSKAAWGCPPPRRFCPPCRGSAPPST